MNKTIFFIISVLFTAFLSGCNTLYSTQMVTIEIMEPAKVKLPSDYKNLVVRYNNTNVAWHPETAGYYVESELRVDSTNLDSIASEIYFDLFLETLNEQAYFDSIEIIEPGIYSHTEIVDTLAPPKIDVNDTIIENVNMGQIGSYTLYETLNTIKPEPVNVQKQIHIDPEFGIYSKEDISRIADTTNADLLLSLDHFYTKNGSMFFPFSGTANQVVQVHYFWTAYDLNKNEMVFHVADSDTIAWTHTADFKREALKNIPNRKDAVLNAADLAGVSTARYLVPHWIDVERMYYRSGHVDMKPATELAEQGKWMEAAELWKQNMDNPNKKIVAKCKYNMAVACEMNDDLDAALAWVVESYHMFGEKNEIHAAQCKQYILILSQRKVDRSLIDRQFDTAE